VTTCELRRRFRGDEHGQRLADGQEVCGRESCRRKRDDLRQHVAYKEEVASRNGQARCGEPACERRPAGQCSKCNGLFCGGHVEDTTLEERQSGGFARVRVSLCRHCRRRRAIWAQR